MISHLKKMIVLVPCMLIGLFFFSNTVLSAADAKLIDGGAHDAVFVGSENKSNTYYFTNDNKWTFRADFELIKSLDTYLKYRVINPDGKATEWSDYQEYVDNDGVFEIKFDSLNFDLDDDGKYARDSVVSERTYYVDIKYYSSIFLWKWDLTTKDQKKDETLKVVVSEEKPSIDFSYSELTQKHTINAFFGDGSDKTGIITEILYFSSPTIKNIEKESEFYNYMNESVTKKTPVIEAGTKVSTSIEGADATNKYVYVLVKTGNGTSKISRYDVVSKSQEGDIVPTKVENEKNEGSGLFDYEFGELILLVLVIVLVVSCALIITQKIVDYKKRLY